MQGELAETQHRALSRLRSMLATKNDEAHRIQTHIAVTKSVENDPSEDIKELDNLLADADRAFDRSSLWVMLTASS